MPPQLAIPISGEFLENSSTYGKTLPTIINGRNPFLNTVKGGFT
jgi:hypothetical protein